MVSMVEPAWLRIRYEIEKGLRAVGVGCAKVDTSFWCWLMMTTDKRSSLHKKLSPRKSCHLRSVHIDFELDSRLDATFGMFSALGLSFYVILLQNTQWWAKARFLLHPSPISIGLRAHPLQPAQIWRGAELDSFCHSRFSFNVSNHVNHVLW